MQSIGIAVDNSEEATKLFVRPDEGIYPQTHTEVTLPDITPKTLSMADLLHHQHHMTNKLVDYGCVFGSSKGKDA